MRKRYALLLEALIALTLFSLLCTTLFGAYRRMTSLKREMRLLMEEFSEKQHLYHMLKELFGHIISPENEKCYFFTPHSQDSDVRGPSLVFSFDNAKDPSPEFSSTQLGHLYMDREGQLVLAYWPILWERKDNLYRKEILVRHLDKIEFSFYNPKKTDAEEPPAGLISQWENKYKELPAIVKLTLFPQNGEPLSYSFIIEEAGKWVNYPKDHS